MQFGAGVAVRVCQGGGGGGGGCGQGFGPLPVYAAERERYYTRHASVPPQMRAMRARCFLLALPPVRTAFAPSSPLSGQKDMWAVEEGGQYKY